MIREAPAIRAATRAIPRFAARDPWMLSAAVTTAALAIVAIRALADGVQLIDERALFELRARDVFTADHPWLGTRSTGGDFNHPGPLLFDLFSVPVRVMGGPVGVTLTVIAVHIAMIWLSGAAARRLGGPDLALVVVAAATVLCWTMGSDLLIDPWPANFLVLSFFALLVLTSAVVAGDHRWLPLVVGIASLCAQPQLSYILLAPAMVLVGVGAVIVKAWRQPARSSRRALTRSATVVVVAWLQPMWQQLFGSGPGNLSEIFLAGRGVEHRTGWRLGTRMLASILAKPPAWWRPSYDSDESLAAIGPDGHVIGSSRLLSFNAALGVLAVLVLVAVWCLLWSGRRGFTAAKPMLFVGAVASVVALVTASTVPLDQFGASAYKFRYLWPIGAFVATTFAITALHALKPLMLPERWGTIARWIAPGRWATAVIVVLAVMFACLTVPTRNWSEGDFSRRDVWPVSAALRSQLAAFEPEGIVVVETEHVPFPDYFSWAIMSELDRRGIEFVVDTTDGARQVGSQRYVNGSADVRLSLAVGDWAGATFDGTRQIAYFDGGQAGLRVGVYVGESTGETVIGQRNDCTDSLPQCTV